MLPHEGDFAQHRKSVAHHLFISYLRNLYIIIYIFIYILDFFFKKHKFKKHEAQNAEIVRNIEEILPG